MSRKPTDSTRKEWEDGKKAHAEHNARAHRNALHPTEDWDAQPVQPIGPPSAGDDAFGLSAADIEKRKPQRSIQFSEGNRRSSFPNVDTLDEPPPVEEWGDDTAEVAAPYHRGFEEIHTSIDTMRTIVERMEASRQPVSVYDVSKIRESQLHTFHHLARAMLRAGFPPNFIHAELSYEIEAWRKDGEDHR